ncbi:M24 family metallopeptidase [Natronococcus wangiae]|uniref:M24 family metallopeptidase n=1 Tax=Natronococcus wangiae TaxID=3068275 RepID=UPI00274027A1|nr:Xaa-Pro peptidase family protein [Natronococcus sp. AD5]
MAQLARIPFSTAEYRDRLHETQRRMEDRDLDVLLVTDPANMFYLSGYDAYSFYVPQILIITPEQDQPLWVGREQDYTCATETTWLDPDNIVVYTDEYVDSDKHPMSFVADILAEQGLATRDIGVEMDAYYFSAHAYHELSRALPEATLHDVTKFVNHVRMIKSDAEVDCHRQAARISERAMQKGIDAIDVGVRQSDAAATVYEALLEGTETTGGDYPAIVPLMPSGEGTGSPHLTWTNETYKEGEPVILELAGVVNRYHSPLTRTIFLGEPPERVRTASQIIVDGLDAAIDAVEPGVTCETVEQAWRDEISGTIVEKESRIGYSTGIGYPPSWVEKTASIRPGDTTELQPNMVFHMIPGVWFDEYGIEISESLVVMEDGAEVLADVPRELIVK